MKNLQLIERNKLPMQEIQTTVNKAAWTRESKMAAMKLKRSPYIEVYSLPVSFKLYDGMFTDTVLYHYVHYPPQNWEESSYLQERFLIR